GELLEVTGRGYNLEGKFLHRQQAISPQKHKVLNRLLEIAVCCNNASMEPKESAKGFWKKRKSEWKVDGDPTEIALLVAGAKGGVTTQQLHQQWERVKEYPFDSNRKRMSVIVQNRNGKRMLMMKGAPEVVIPRCSKRMDQDRLHLLSARDRNELLRVNDQL